MIGKGSKLYSVLHGMCPRCQEGKIFKNPPYSSIDFTQMHHHCSSCKQAFEPEPDFYQGAMYVSYGLSTGLFLMIGGVMLFVFEINLWITFVAIGLTAVLLLPVIFRVSRIIWLNLFVGYKPVQATSRED